MIEAYAFFAAFTVQILAVSVLVPFWVTGAVRARAASIPAEHFGRLYPGDHNLTLSDPLIRPVTTMGTANRRTQPATWTVALRPADEGSRCVVVRQRPRRVFVLHALV